MATIASLMMSAEVPWMGALTALRSASERTVAFLELMSAIYLLRPKTVSTYPVSLAAAMVSSMNERMDGKDAK